MKHHFLAALLLAAAPLLHAQTCFELAVQKGQTAYDAGRFAQARQYWEAGKDCPDADAKKLDKLIWKTRDDDQDGVVNGRDKCPKEYGKNNGCPPREDAATAAARAADDAYWDALKDGDAAACDKYLKRYPNGRHAAEARKRKELLAGSKSKTPTTTAAPEGFVLVKGGTFQMGDVMGDSVETNEQVHTVTVSDFYLAKHELTFDEYDAFCTATGRDKPSDNGWGRGQRPVIHVNWYDAVEYCNWRSQQDSRRPAYTIQGEQVSLNSGANGYRLPTEAEWEYAAREGGKKVRFGNGRDVIDPSEINFDASSSYKKPYSVMGEYRRKTVAVSDLSANTLGLKNMSGNVWEWCQDWYAAYPTAAQTNPTGPSEGAYRVLRGGSWLSPPQYCRAASRSSDTPTYRRITVGFRLASPLQ